MRQKTLEVYYKGRLVGILAETKDRLVAFQYSDEWLKNGFLIKVGTEAGLKPAACEDMLQNVRTHISDLLPYIGGEQGSGQLGKRQVDELLRDYEDSSKKGGKQYERI